MTTLLIVESPTKAKTIKKFLPAGYEVAASMGHVRDLPSSAAEIPEAVKKEPWAQIGVNYMDDFQPLYVIPEEKKKIVKNLKDLVKAADQVILATDVDREGESISWHLMEVLGIKKGAKRMVFHEITKDAILKAIKECREINTNMVHAQETRRILDRLVGYTLSPLLWRKVAMGLSAGRVQSAAVKLVVERERERISFVQSEFWGVKANMVKGGQQFEAELVRINEKRLASGKNFDEKTGKFKADASTILVNQKQAEEIVSKLGKLPFLVSELESKSVQKHPYPPFTTSTLQQEANRKMRMSARETMRVAQSLYEQGLITYMRTDSVSLSDEAIQGVRRMVSALYGKEYLHTTVRSFQNKSKNAQEAHEAIRPAGDLVQPEKSGLSGRDLAIYSMIWKRTMATQIAPARINYIVAHLEAEGHFFRASGKKIEFPGFLKVYIEDTDNDADRDDSEAYLPPLSKGEQLKPEALKPTQHRTQTPPRYTESSLISSLESESIGRPSTYASIISTIQDRKYVFKDKNALCPTFTAFCVTQLLEENFPDLVDLKFTASMEEILDDIAVGKQPYRKYLGKFYHGDAGLMSQAQAKTESISSLKYKSLQFSKLKDRVCIGKFGPFLERDVEDGKRQVSIPPDLAPAELDQFKADELFEAKKSGVDALGEHPVTKEKIFIFNGKFGPYLQLGITEDPKHKPKRAPLLKSMTISDVNIEHALRLLSMPLKLGTHPEQKGEIVLSTGRFGPFVCHEKIDKSKEYRSVKDTEVMTMNLERALELLSTEKPKRGSSIIREIGEHPSTHKKIVLCKGPYGHYIKYGKENCALGKGVTGEDMTLEAAVKLVDNRGSAGGKSAKGKFVTAKKTRALSTKKASSSIKTAPAEAEQKTPTKSPRLKKKS